MKAHRGGERGGFGLRPNPPRHRPCERWGGFFIQIFLIHFWHVVFIIFMGGKAHRTAFVYFRSEDVRTKKKYTKSRSTMNCANNLRAPPLGGRRERGRQGAGRWTTDREERRPDTLPNERGGRGVPTCKG